MKLGIFGICFLIIGFISPFYLKHLPVGFFYSGIYSGAFFWIGFFLILHPQKFNSSLKAYLKWGSWGLWVNIILSSVVLFYLLLTSATDRMFNQFEFYAIPLLTFIANPVQSIFDSVVAKPTTQLPNGSIIIVTTFIRTLSTTFLNLIFFISTGMFLKFLQIKFKQR